MGITHSSPTEQLLVIKSQLESPSESLIVILRYDLNLKRSNYLSLAVVLFLVGAGRDSVSVNTWEM